MKINKKLLVFILASLLGNIIIYPFIPGKIPHKNFQMVIDGYSDKWTLFLMPLTTVFMYFLLYFLGKLDKKNEMNKKTYELITIMTVLFFTILNIWFIMYSFGLSFAVTRMLSILIGMFFVIMGNYFPRLKTNSIFGIRTPWTLKNDQVWKYTHRFGGYVLVASGFICFIGSLLNSITTILTIFAVTLLCVLITALYSYINYKKCVKE